MPTIIRDLPYFDQLTRVQVRGRSFSVKRDQIVVWIGITEKGIQDLDPRTPCFPAILDIGCNYNLLINEQHLTGWAGIQPGYLRQLVRMRVANLNMPYVTSVERIAEARAGVSLLLRQLAKVCGCLPEDVTNRVRSLPFPQIEELSEALLDFRSLADLQNWLGPSDEPAE